MPNDRPSLREAAQRGVGAKRPQVQPGGKPPAPPVVRTEKVTAACGHEVDFGLFEDKKDKYRDDRREKKRGQLCPACREQKEREVQEAARLRRQEKAEKRVAQPETRKKRHPPERLPDGSGFNVVYDAGKEEWSGTLTVGSDTFTASASGVFKLLEKLDRLYRNQVQALVAPTVPTTGPTP
jgi:hypothetical protein